jgi:hypothetical protein
MKTEETELHREAVDKTIQRKGGHEAIQSTAAPAKGISVKKQTRNPTDVGVTKEEATSGPDEAKAERNNAIESSRTEIFGPGILQHAIQPVREKATEMFTLDSLTAQAQEDLRLLRRKADGAQTGKVRKATDNTKRRDQQRVFYTQQAESIKIRIGQTVRLAEGIPSRKGLLAGEVCRVLNFKGTTPYFHDGTASTTLAGTYQVRRVWDAQVLGWFKQKELQAYAEPPRTPEMACSTVKVNDTGSKKKSPTRSPSYRTSRSASESRSPEKLAAKGALSRGSPGSPGKAAPAVKPRTSWR